MNGVFDKEEVAKLAYHIERNELGISGGYQDQWAASFGGFNLLKFERDGVFVQPLRLSHNFLEELENDIIMVYLGKRNIQGSSIHNDQKETMINDKEMINKILLDKRENVIEMKSALEDEDIESFGSFLDKEWQLKKLLSSKISSPYIDDIYDFAKKHGALGGKVSGAGAGGCGFFFVLPEKKTGLLSALHKIGLEEIPFKFDKNGVEAWRV